MATREQLENALMKADAAGDVDGAMVLAQEIKRQRAAAPAAPQPRTLAEKAKFAGGHFEAGLASIPGMAVDTAENVANLGISGYGMARQLWGRARGEKPWEAASHAPDPVSGWPGSTEWIQKQLQMRGAMPSEEVMTPRTKGEQYGARALEFAGGSMLPMSREARLRDLWKQAAMGGTAGLTSQAAQNIFPDSRLAPALAALATGYASKPLTAPISRVGNAFARRYRDPRAVELENLSKQWSVPLTYGETSESRIPKSAEQALENVPFVGLQKFRIGQQAAAKTAGQRLVEEYEAGQRFEDPGKDVQKSLQRVLDANKKEASRLYDAVGAEAGQPGVVNRIGVGNTKAELAALLHEYPDIFDRLPDQSLRTKLQAISGSVADQQVAGKPAGKIVLPDGKPAIPGTPPTQKPTELTFQEARFLRKKLGNYINRANRSAGVVGDDEVRQLVKVKAALDADINTWGEKLGGNAVKAFRKANAYYRENIDPFNEATVDKVTGKEFDTDTMMKTIIKSDRPQLAQKIVSKLDAHGRQALKYGVIKDAFDGSMNDLTGNFSPQKFATSVSKLGKTLGIVFSSDEKNQIEGFNKLMAAAARAGQFGESPPTGYRVLQTGGALGTLYAVATHPAATAAAATTMKSLSLLFTTTAGKRLLLAANRTPAQSKAWDSLVDRATVLASRQATLVDQREREKRRSQRQEQVNQ